MGRSKEGSRTPLSKYAIEISAHAAKYLVGIPKPDQLRIVGVIDLLGDNPLPPKALKLRGREGYRIRVGDYRILYTFDGKVMTVLIIKIGHRKDVYRVAKL